MKKFISLAILAGTMMACSSPCEKYVDAAASCAEEAGSDVEDTEGVCEDDDGANDELYECMADAYGSADCSTDEGALEAAFSALECAGDIEDLFDTGS